MRDCGGIGGPGEGGWGVDEAREDKLDVGDLVPR